jgi:SAM-dependent methyltransferase
VQAHGCTAVGLDPMAGNVATARARAREAGVEHHVHIARAIMEHLPHADGTFDFIWSRDTLALIGDLPAGLAEAARVLRPGGHMLAYVVFATERLEPREAAMLNEPLGNVPANMDQTRVEALFATVGLRVAVKDVISTEWREYEEERTQPASTELLQLARLRRQREQFVAEFGEEMFRMVEASAHWLPYILLGKLLPVMYVLQRKG